MYLCLLAEVAEVSHCCALVLKELITNHPAAVKSASEWTRVQIPANARLPSILPVDISSAEESERWSSASDGLFPWPVPRSRAGERLPSEPEPELEEEEHPQIAYRKQDLEPPKKAKKKRNVFTEAETPWTPIRVRASRAERTREASVVPVFKSPLRMLEDIEALLDRGKKRSTTEVSPSERTEKIKRRRIELLSSSPSIFEASTRAEVPARQGRSSSSSSHHPGRIAPTGNRGNRGVKTGQRIKASSSENSSEESEGTREAREKVREANLLRRRKRKAKKKGALKKAAYEAAQPREKLYGPRVSLNDEGFEDIALRESVHATFDKKKQYHELDRHSRSVNSTNLPAPPPVHPRRSAVDRDTFGCTSPEPVLIPVARSVVPSAPSLRSATLSVRQHSERPRPPPRPQPQPQARGPSSIVQQQQRRNDMTYRRAELRIPTPEPVAFEPRPSRLHPSRPSQKRLAFYPPYAMGNPPLARGNRTASDPFAQPSSRPRPFAAPPSQSSRAENRRPDFTPAPPAVGNYADIRKRVREMGTAEPWMKAINNMKKK